MILSQLYMGIFFLSTMRFIAVRNEVKIFFFKLVLELVLRTLNICSTEYDSENQGYETSGVRSPLNTIWSILQKVVEEILRLWNKKKQGNSCYK